LKIVLISITIVSCNRLPILTKYINLLIKSYKNVSRIYKFELIAYSVLNNHLHCIIAPETINDYPKIIKSFKYSFTKNVGLVNPTYNRVLQNRYWEHTIRSETDLNLHLNYIHYNPLKHGLVQSVKDWKYSSFQKFVKQGLYAENWGSNEDVKNIKDLNFE